MDQEDTGQWQVGEAEESLSSQGDPQVDLHSPQGELVPLSDPQLPLSPGVLVLFAKPRVLLSPVWPPHTGRPSVWG